MSIVDEAHVDPEQIRAWALRWRAAWEKHWAAGTLHEVLPLYSEDVVFRSFAHREADHGHAGVGAVFDTFQAGAVQVECRFGEPVVEGRRAVLEWWACWLEDGANLSMAGCSWLWFNADGLVAASRDYWNIFEGTSKPYEGW